LEAAAGGGGRGDRAAGGRGELAGAGRGGRSGGGGGGGGGEGEAVRACAMVRRVALVAPPPPEFESPVVTDGGGGGGGDSAGGPAANDPGRAERAERGGAGEVGWRSGGGGANPAAAATAAVCARATAWALSFAAAAAGPPPGPLVAGAAKDMLRDARSANPPPCGGAGAERGSAPGRMSCGAGAGGEGRAASGLRPALGGDSVARKDRASGSGVGRAGLIIVQERPGRRRFVPLLSCIGLLLREESHLGCWPSGADFLVSASSHSPRF
jgi:hypothetical protein